MKKKRMFSWWSVPLFAAFLSLNLSFLSAKDSESPNRELLDSAFSRNGRYTIETRQHFKTQEAFFSIKDESSKVLSQFKVNTGSHRIYSRHISNDGNIVAVFGSNWSGAVKIYFLRFYKSDGTLIKNHFFESGNVGPPVSAQISLDSSYFIYASDYTDENNEKTPKLFYYNPATGDLLWDLKLSSRPQDIKISGDSNHIVLLLKESPSVRKILLLNKKGKIKDKKNLEIVLGSHGGTLIFESISHSGENLVFIERQTRREKGIPLRLKTRKFLLSISDETLSLDEIISLEEID